jgi:hypothetical protein
MKSTGLTRVATCLALAFAATPALSADSFWNSKNAYLGEPPPGDTPRAFAPGRLAEPGTFVMGRSAFSRDGREFYFSQNDSWKSGEHAKVRRMRFTGGSWTAPETIATEAVSPTLSLDEQQLFLRKKGMNNVWVSLRQGAGWKEPRPFLELARGLYDFMPTISGRYYVGSEPDTADKARGSTFVISLLKLEGKTPRIESLGAPLNGPGFNGDFFIAPDESYMVLSAKVTADFESQAFIAFRRADGTWTQPVSLGERINDGPAHRWGYFVPASGDYLFYSWGTSERDCELRWVRFAELRERLRPTH